MHLMLGTMCLFITAILVLAIVILVKVMEDPEVATNSAVVAEVKMHAPPLPGVAQNGDKPKIILAQDINYPPFAYLGIPPEGDYKLAGIVIDVVEGLNEICDLDIVTVQTDWSNCWNAGSIGEGLSAGYFHGCMSYTHTAGERNRFLEFTKGILNVNKAAGLLVRLNQDGTPAVSPSSDLNGANVVDVTGWAPTADGLAFVTNDCTGKKFEGWTMNGTPATYNWRGKKNGESSDSDLTFDNPNDVALAMLLEGDADAVWIYSDMAHEYSCEDPTRVNEWNCDLWGRFGTEFAYIHTGMFEHAIDGTTLALAKKGSGLAEILNPCLDKFMQTEAYYDICKKYKFEGECYKNSHFDEQEEVKHPWALSTPDLANEGYDCSKGYCSCPTE